MIQTPYDSDRAANTDAEIFTEVDKNLRIAVEVEGANRTRAVEALEFFDGNQWPQDLYNQRRNRVTLTINHCAMLCRRVLNNMRQQRPRIKVHPTGDGARVEDARIVGGLIRHIENISSAGVAYDTAGESSVKIGWGYARVISEYIDPESFDQELKVVGVRNTLTGYIDPSAVLPDGSDMEWFIFTEKMKRQEFERLYPDEAKIDWSFGGDGDSTLMWQSKDEIRLAEYYRIKHVKDTLYKLSDGRSILKSDFDREVFALAGITIIDKRATQRRQVQWFRLSGRNIVDKRDLKGRFIPVVRCEGNCADINGEIRRSGMIKDMMDPARQYNYWQSAKTEKLALSPKAPWIGTAEQFDGQDEWDDANQKPYSKLTYNLIKDINGSVVPVPPPQRAPPVEVEAGFVEAGQSAEKDLLSIAGMPHDPQMDAPGQVISGKALRQRQAMSDIAHFQFYDNQTAFIAQIGRILLDLIPFYYDTPRMQRIIGDDGMPEMVQINERIEDQIKNDLTVGRYDVVMDTGPGYDTKRQEGAEAMASLLMIKPIAEQVAKVGSDLVVRGIDAPYMEELANRLATTNPEGMQKAIKELPPQAQAIVSSLQGQLQQAQQQVQHLQMEIKFKSDIEKGWMDTEIKKTLMQTHTKAHDTDTRAQSAIDVAEIKEAGSILDSHVQAGHQAKAAEAQMVRDGEMAAQNAKSINGSQQD